ncbi:MAG: hypothetical protein AzoDbin1_05382 [Azoarcus sp.]|nr:hypothetical protein [Azoarcus sp.]
MSLNDRIVTAATVLIAVCAVVLTTNNVLTAYRRSRQPTTSAIGAVPDWPAYAAGSLRLGPSAPLVQVVVFSDFECPACKRFAERMTSLLRTSNGNLGLVFHNYPLPSHLRAREAANAAACASAQGQFQSFHDRVFSGVVPGSALEWASFAAALPVADSAGFMKCLKSEWADSLVQADVRMGDRLGVNATPTILIGDSLYSGLPWDLEKIIAAQVARARAPLANN